mmetsp:Transcript_25451/g.24340  ORF Transcript_25451/g.24340 Transcript_25451/m.24340 type:complete len:289 (-) Transcript_25451:12-878(-)
MSQIIKCITYVMIIYMQSASSFTKQQFAYKKSGILNYEITKKLNDFKLYSTNNEDINDDVNDDNNEIEKVKRKMSWPFEMYDAPEQLDGSLACDLGFDPLGIVKNQKQLFFLREAEIKHARIAMLAAIGWPASELYHYTIAEFFGGMDLLAEGDKAPSVLNGGLDNFFILLGLGSFFAVGSVLEFEYMKRKKEIPESLANFYDMWQDENGWDVPGNYDFDPFRLRDSICGEKTGRKKIVQSLEMINGRLAMLATLGFAVQEVVTGLPVIDETPGFFYPFFNPSNNPFL